MRRYASALLKEMPPVFSVAGFSLGGLVALEMIAQAPDRVERLALISAGAGPEAEGGAEMRRAGEDAAKGLGMVRHVLEELVPRYSVCRDQARVSARLVAMAETLGPDIYRRQNDLAITRADSRPRLERIACPVLLATGSEDILCPPSMHAEIMPLLPHATRAEISGCGHLVPLEAPHAVRGLIGELLSKPLRSARNSG
jgi:pimeloyl-ACP methyl ester carboxylesterase